MNNQIKKKRNHIIIFSSTGILLFAVILTIVLVSIHLNKKPIDKTKPYVKEGVHFGSDDYILDYRLGQPSGTLRVTSIWISYRIDIEKDTYDYDEEFVIRYRIDHFHPERETSDLKIKFISDNFTFLSPTEYVYNDCKEFGVDLGVTESPVDIQLRVKATKTISIIDHILVLLDFDMSEEYKAELIRRRKEDEEERGKYYNFYRDYRYYYNNDFQLMQFIYHINDELGTILIDESNSKTIQYQAEDNSYQKIIVEAFDLAMYKSLNRLYEKNIITKKEYVDRIFRCASENRPMVISVMPYVESNRDSYTYYSNNIRMFFSIDEKCLTYGYDVTPNVRAKQLINIAYEEGIITKEEYDTEVDLIDSTFVKHNHYSTFDFPSKIVIDYYMISALIPFDDYQSYWCDYVIRK
ncbi:MAG: hypothetical protein K2M08_03615 [Anaeroplasmataceae bacterium]|nr:hypothetical protein [Anaeroplasmataceae bacterium]